MSQKYIKRISKSQYLKGLQCPLALWYYRHRPDLKPEIPPAKQALFDAGHEVGVLAQQYFQGGVEITEPYYQIDQAIKSTHQAVAGSTAAIFEATACSDDGAYSRIDILKRVGPFDTWDLVEVKMSTGVKDYHMDDMALQRYAFRGAGYQIRKSILMHLNNQYVRFGDLDVEKFFTLENCTPAVSNRLSEVQANVAALIQMLNRVDEPVIAPGEQCYDPFECDYTGHCIGPGPEFPVQNIFRPGRRLNTLLADNILDVRDIPVGFDATERERIAMEACRSNQVYTNRATIADWLEQLEYPLYFLDYETINPPVPLFDNSRPFQQIPFQFSMHIQRTKGGALEHAAFLHTDTSDPRPDLIRCLIDSCGTAGSLVVYNQAFENRINNELGAAFPEFKDALNNISDRMQDLLIPFRSRFIYHPQMNGSASLKSVLPAFVSGLSYDDLAIRDGETASLMYLNCIKDAVSDQEKTRIFQDLKTYCALDTLAEVKLLEVLYGSI